MFDLTPLFITVVTTVVTIVMVIIVWRAISYRRAKAHASKLLEAVQLELRKSLKVLDRITRSGDQLSSIVGFFNVVSIWHDRGFDDLITALEAINRGGKYSGIILDLQTLSAHCQRARDPFGWNRTTKGQVVTDDNVFLGNVYGLFTKTVAYWRQQKDAPKGGWGYPKMEHLNAYDVVCRQAGEFLDAHCKPMIVILNRLDQVGIQ